VLLLLQAENELAPSTTSIRAMEETFDMTTLAAIGMEFS
jgi:hypothetical protein